MENEQRTTTFLFFKRKSLNDTHFGVAALAPLVDLFTLLVVAILRSSSPEPAFKCQSNTNLSITK